MSGSAQDISKSHLDLRLAVPPGRDEISVMAETLNKLIERRSSGIFSSKRPWWGGSATNCARL